MAYYVDEFGMVSGSDDGAGTVIVAPSKAPSLFDLPGQIAGTVVHNLGPTRPTDIIYDKSNKVAGGFTDRFTPVNYFGNNYSNPVSPLEQAAGLALFGSIISGSAYGSSAVGLFNQVKNKDYTGLISDITGVDVSGAKDIFGIGNSYFDNYHPGIVSTPPFLGGGGSGGGFSVKPTASSAIAGAVIIGSILFAGYFLVIRGK